MTTPDIPSLVESVLRLDKEATPGPWTLGGIFNPDTPSAFRYVYPPKNIGRSKRPLAINVAVCDAALIAEYRTAAPILARACNEKDAELTRLRAELAVKHELACTLQSQVDNADVNLEQVKLIQKGIWRTKVESAESRIEALEKELAEAKRKVEVATAAINQAPHHGSCITWIVKAYRQRGERIKDQPCDCWKSLALAALTAPTGERETENNL